MHIAHIHPDPDARLAHEPAQSASSARRLRRLLCIAVFSAACGILLGRNDHAASVEPELATVLRFMAAMKAAMALAALIAARWRLRAPASSARAAALTAAVALMAASPGLIWGLGHVGLGAALFLPGVVVFAVAAMEREGRVFFF